MAIIHKLGVLLFVLGTIQAQRGRRKYKAQAKDFIGKLSPKWFYFSEIELDYRMGVIDRQNMTELNEEWIMGINPDEQNIATCEDICFSSTFFSILVTTVCFSIAACVIIAL